MIIAETAIKSIETERVNNERRSGNGKWTGCVCVFLSIAVWVFVQNGCPIRSIGCLFCAQRRWLRVDIWGYYFHRASDQFAQILWCWIRKCWGSVPVGKPSWAIIYYCMSSFFVFVLAWMWWKWCQRRWKVPWRILTGEQSRCVTTKNTEINKR